MKTIRIVQQWKNIFSGQRVIITDVSPAIIGYVHDNDDFPHSVADRKHRLPRTAFLQEFKFISDEKRD